MVRNCRKAKGMVESGVGASSTYMQLRSRRIVKKTTVVFLSENSSSVASSSSCCPNNSKNDLLGEFIDLEEKRDGESETSTYRKSRKRKLFENLTDKSMENSSAEISLEVKDSSDCCCSGRKSLSGTEEKAVRPTETEIDEFFAEVEKQLETKFTKKYNFDFEKEEPLEGRYEWVKVFE